MKLCEKLYELRRAAGLSQEELAERLNVSRQAVSKWENGAAQPELSKLVELSRLYGVSVDELLSLEEAEKGDAKAASSVETSTPAPAQETLTAPKKVRRQKLLLGAAAVCLALAVGLALYNNHRVKQLEWQVGSLQSQIMSVQSSLSSQIAGISSSVREAMEESATLTAQFDYTVKRFDLDAYTCTVAFALRPKTVQDDLAVSLRLRSLASDDGTTAVELVRDEYDVYRGETVLSMNDAGFEATAAYDTGGERQLETIRDLPGFANEALPKLYEDLSSATATANPIPARSSGAASGAGRTPRTTAPRTSTSALMMPTSGPRGSTIWWTERARRKARSNLWRPPATSAPPCCGGSATFPMRAPPAFTASMAQRAWNLAFPTVRSCRSYSMRS